MLNVDWSRKLFLLLVKFKLKHTKTLTERQQTDRNIGFGYGHPSGKLRAVVALGQKIKKKT